MRDIYFMLFHICVYIYAHQEAWTVSIGPNNNSLLPVYKM